MVANVLVGIFAVLCAAATYLVASAALARGDRAALAVSLIPGVLTVVFAAILVLMAVQRRRERALAERRALNPEAPWLWTDKWRDGRIHSTSSWGSAAIVVVFAAVWNAAFGAAGLTLYWRGDLWGEPGLVVFLLIVAAAGLALIAGAVYMVLLARKYPPTVFDMTAVPGVLGGQLAGSIQIPARVPAGVEARVKLACDRARRSSTGPLSWTLWQDELTVTTPASGSLPVTFTIPFDLPPSELPERAGMHDASPISWTLSVTVRVPGVDYLETFGVPVFATAASDPSIVAGTVEASQSADRPSHAKASLIESSAERTVFALPPAKGLGCGLSAFLILPLLAWPIARSAGSDAATALVACGIALIAGAAVLALSAGAVALSATSIEIDREAIRVPHGRWPVRWIRTIPLADVAEIRCALGEGQRVDVLTRQGASYWISGDVSGPEEAKWLAAEVTRAVERYRASTAAST